MFRVPAARRAAFVLSGLTICLLALLAVQRPGKAQAKYTHFQWQEVAGGVWFGISPPNSFISGNTVIVALPEGGTLVVDPHITQSVADEIIAKAKEVNGDVRILVNTHLHNDHTQGNMAFARAFPDVQIYAHANTCEGIKAKAMPRQQMRLANLPGQLEQIRKAEASVTDPKVKADLQRIIAGNELYLADYKTHKWVLPNHCLPLEPGETVTLAGGDRPVILGYYGRAHTAGDVVVFLPKEKILINGDLWGANGIFDGGRDGSGLEFPGTLRRIAQLDFDTVLPGHGGVLKGKEVLEKGIASAEKLIAEVKAARAKGQYVEMIIAELSKQRPPTQTPAGSLAAYVPYMSTPANAAFSRNVTRISEEIEFREQMKLPIP